MLLLGNALSWDGLKCGVEVLGDDTTMNGELGLVGH